MEVTPQQRYKPVDTLTTPPRYNLEVDMVRLPEATLAPKPFAGTQKDIDNSERWLRYLKQYVKYRHLYDDEALTLFKLLLIEQAQDWVHALPKEEIYSFDALAYAFKQRYTPNRLQRYQKASNMWTRTQQTDESVDTYITALRTAANDIKFDDQQQIGYCIIRGLRPALRLHVLQNPHETLEQIIHSARVAEIATTGVNDNEKSVTELSRTVALLVDKLAAKEATATRIQSAAVAAVDTAPRPPQRRSIQTTAPTYNRPNIRPLMQIPGPRQPQQPRTNYYQPRQQEANQQRNCGNCLLIHPVGRCPAFNLQCFICNRNNHFARACRSRPRQQTRFNSE